jgi:D-glycero-D-manno-heptose 1,7-bisphosphate phosphatase
MRPAVFLDRDGTIIEDVGYLRHLDQVEFYPWSVDAIRALNRAGLPVVVITNQAGIARGLLTEALVHQTHRAMSERLAAGGARIDAFYYCPHHPDGKVDPYVRECDCRKPGWELVRRAAADLDLDPSRSFFVGDTWLDVGAGRAAGARTILLRRGKGGHNDPEPPPDGLEADARVENLAAAVSWILGNPTC